MKKRMQELKNNAATRGEKEEKKAKNKMATSPSKSSAKFD